MIRLLLILCLQHFIHPLKALSSPNAPKGRGATVWKPPSQNVAQRRGKIFDIQSPEDLLHFIIEDDRLSVVKVYASWCATCKKFDVRYRKIANQYGDTYDDAGMQISRRGMVRFAEMQYDNPANRELCQDVLKIATFPYMLLYKGRKGKVDEFHCSPAKFQRLVDAVKEHLEDEEEGGEGGIHHYPKYFEH